MAKFIFTTGGVSSSLGKGLASAALGALLQARGLTVRLRKLDPYLNVDPGTMNPYQHGEVFVTSDGAEADLDLGHYERFTNQDATKFDSVTSGRIYSSVIAKERRGDYLGATVQVIPHITDEIKAFICNGSDDVDIIICEVGGTVGDIEALPFFEAMRQLRNELGNENSLLIHVTLLPFLAAAGELKTKPTQHSVQALQTLGLRPDILLCRSEHEIPDDAKQKLALFCNVAYENVIRAQDAGNIYEIPTVYHKEGLDAAVAKAFKINAAPDLKPWNDLIVKLKNPKSKVRIGIVGKYVQLKDAYKSLDQAITHAGIAEQAEIEKIWIDAEDKKLLSKIQGVDGLIIPGGFGERGIDGKIKAINYARKNNVPLLGICLGMQLSVVEAARTELGMVDASSTEFGTTNTPIVARMTEWMSGEQKELRGISDDMGGTMRLGSFACTITEGTLAHNLYNKTQIDERHRHRYEVNFKYRDVLESKGYVFSGMSPDGLLPEIVEYHPHPFFIACQFHPELKSRPFSPHPLFTGLVRACLPK